jgi:hypothetical protein
MPAAQIIFVAGARTAFTGDLVRVDDRGVMNLVKAMQVGGAARRPGSQMRLREGSCQHVRSRG